jgi:hypothetical protein
MVKTAREKPTDLIANFPSGLYKTKRDLLDILAPYFEAELLNNEFYPWVDVKDADGND